MPLNEQQEKIVNAHGCTVNVAAGAGTGKTFTLTRRVVECLGHIIESEPDHPKPLEGILAITFTTKAADELRSRVRSALFDEAMQTGSSKILECALHADDSWISTIHGMASRILRDNALPFGIDPDFQVLTDPESDAVFSQALENVLAEVEYSSGLSDTELFTAYQMKGFGPNSPGIKELLKSVFARVSYMPDGLDGAVCAEPEDSPSELMRRMYQASEPILMLLEEGEWPEKQVSKKDQYLDAMQSAREEAECWLGLGCGGSFLDGGLDIGSYLDTLFAFPPTTDKYPASPKEYQEAFREYRAEYKDIAKRAFASAGVRLLHPLLDIARKVQAEIEAIKSAGKPMLDNSDLLLKCKAELSAPENIDILKMYSDQFRYIMLDEFQDTDRLQMDLVSLISCSRDGVDENAAQQLRIDNVCTVGDMQQSIYRFRGGDVRLAKQRAQALADHPGTVFELTGNYRSHKDILDSVELIFSREDAFGDSFLRLDAKAPGLDLLAQEAFKDQPRVTFDYINYGKNGPANKADARLFSARLIAKEFARLKAGGIGAGKMAVLLGSMSNADIYADALAEYGLDSLIAGGSGFGYTDEAKLVGYLLEYARNTDDAQGLFNVLTSPLFAVSDSDLLALSDIGRGLRRGLSSVSPLVAGFNRLSKACSGEAGAASFSAAVPDGFEALGAGAVAAASVLSGFVADCRKLCVSRALRRLFAVSGRLFRLSGESAEAPMDISDVSVAANLNKAVAAVEGLEPQCGGIAHLARAYRDYIDTAKEAPGILSTGNTDYVSIMTVHSSKGLEFDHVAVADLKDGTGASSGILAENIDDNTLVALQIPKALFQNKDAYENAKKAMKFASDEEVPVSAEGMDIAVLAASASKMQDALLQYCSDEELAEAQRLLYVAMTRARESLKVVHVKESKPGNTYSGIYGNIYDALCCHFGCSDEGFPETVRAVQLPVGFARYYLDKEPEFSEDGSCAQKEGGIAAASADAWKNEDGSRDMHFEVPVYDPVPERTFERCNLSRRNVCSYTSLHDGGSSLPVKADADCVAGAPIPEVIPDANDSVPSKKGWDSDKATDLGTAFHRIAQIAILNRDMDSVRTLSMPDASAIDAQVASCSLGADSEARLRAALDAWFASNVCNRFAAYENVQAEVPFAVYVPSSEGQEAFTLEGEIDGLADNGGTECMLIDYKTGGHASETPEALHKKHLLQAQCYAYALIEAGYTSVDAFFIRVEQHMGGADGKKAPQTVEYSFTVHDKDALYNVISDARKAQECCK